MSSRRMSALPGEDLILGPELMNTLDADYTVGNPDDDGYFSITWPANHQRHATMIMDCHWIWHIEDEEEDEVQDDASMNSIVSIDASPFSFKEPEPSTVYFDEWGPLVEEEPEETNPFMHGHPLNRELWDEVHQAQTNLGHHIPLDTYSTFPSDTNPLLQDEPEPETNVIVRGPPPIPALGLGWEQDPNNPLHQFMII